MWRTFLGLLLWMAPAWAQAPSIKATLANPEFARVLVAGHRGALLRAPENTFPSFQHAVALGADIIELDVRYTRDGRWVVFHDATLERLTGSPGAIEERTLEEVRQLRINLPQFPAHKDLRVLTLEEALEFLKNRAIAYLDHKTGPAVLLSRELARLGAADRAYIVARTPPWAMDLRRGSPEVHIMGAIDEDEPEALIQEFLPARPTLMELPRKHLTPANIALLKNRGVRVFTN